MNKWVTYFGMVTVLIVPLLHCSSQREGRAGGDLPGKPDGELDTEKDASLKDSFFEETEVFPNDAYETESASSVSDVLLQDDMEALGDDTSLHDDTLALGDDFSMESIEQAEDVSTVREADAGEGDVLTAPDDGTIIPDNDTPYVPNEREMNYYGFVPMKSDNPSIVYPLIASTGAGWVQAEGVESLGIVAVWPLVESSPGNYDFSSLDWISTAKSAGLDILLSINTGHNYPVVKDLWTNAEKKALYYSDYVICDFPEERPLDSVNCPPKDYNHWYQFVYAVAQHFDGLHNAPLVTHFQSMNEAGGLNYYRGSPESMFGGDTTVVIHRNDGRGDIEVPAGWIPVAYLAVHDANKKARFVAGACTDGGGYPWAHFTEAYHAGASPAQIQALIAEYDMSSSLTAQKVINTITNDDESVSGYRQGKYCLQSFRYPQFYDLYAAHWYWWFDSHWIRTWMRSLAYVRDKVGQEKPLWVTGVGGLTPFVPAQEKERTCAVFLFQAMTANYVAGADWFDYTFFANGVVCDLYSPFNYATRFASADLFSFLARLFPSRSAFSLDTSTPSPPDIHFYQFSISHASTNSVGRAALGWCFANSGSSCSKEVDLARLIPFSSGDAFAVFDYRGRVIEHECGFIPSSFTITQDPIIMVWGQSADGDCIPDIADNCPTVSNEGQEEGVEFLSSEYPSIEAFDGVGFACDNCPSFSNQDQIDADKNGVGDACEL